MNKFVEQSQSTITTSCNIHNQKLLHKLTVWIADDPLHYTEIKSKDLLSYILELVKDKASKISVAM